MQNGEIKIKGYASEKEESVKKDFINLFKECPIPDNERLANLGLFLRRQEISKMLFLDELYKKIIDVHGVVMDFGTRWGKNMAFFEALRGMYEPFNHNRRIIGFDTFEGFTPKHEKDGNADILSIGAYAVTGGYEEYLDKVLYYHEQASPIAHIKKYEIIKGDAGVELEKYLKEHQETIIALAYFDFDLYEPTKRCLELIEPHLTRGSVIGFDELNHPDFPGETQAVKDVFGLNKYKIKRMPNSSYKSYVVIE